MKTIEIYKNYGVLAAEKRTVYTFGGAHMGATCSEKMTVVVPDGWELYRNQIGQTMVTAPWGWDYDINEVLSSNRGRPTFWSLDKTGNYNLIYLKEVAKMQKYDKDLFECMINDWVFDNSPKYDDLKIGEVKYDDDIGGWIVTAEDDMAYYLLCDDGQGNIQINSLGSK